MLKILLTMFGIIHITGCTTSTPIRTSTGEIQYYIDCEYDGMSKCYEEANKVCPAGYDVVEAVDRFIPGVFSNDRATNITIQCK